ncbi:hypothetical protein GGI42DRAFT_324279 [Trichoderma sp. SZMC 28013]
MKYRRELFELLDSTVPGHHRYVTLLLVDPNSRICSTRNAPLHNGAGGTILQATH